jgi:hypothetical protein
MYLPAALENAFRFSAEQPPVPLRIQMQHSSKNSFHFSTPLVLSGMPPYIVVRHVVQRHIIMDSIWSQPLAL